MRTSEFSTQRMVWTLLAGSLALVLATGLVLMLSHLQVRAQPAIETTQANLVVEKQVSAATVTPGDALAYTITIENTGDTGTTAWMTDELPTEVTYVPSSLQFTGPGSAGFAGGWITWTAAPIAGFGQKAYIFFQVQIPTDTTATEIVNTAQVTGTGELLTDTASTGVKSALDHEGTYKNVSQAQAEPGDVLTYTLVMNNESISSDVTAQVTDPLPPLLDYVEGSARAVPESSVVVSDSAGITWTVTVSPSASVTLTFQAQVDESAVDGADGALITNTATIEDGSPFERSATVEVNRPPISQIRSPAREAYITQKGTLTISGIAWDGDADPPYLIEDPSLSVQRVSDRSYYVAWTEVFSAENYTLQEATQPDFSDQSPTVVMAPTTNHLVSKDATEDDTYYYRVRATRYGLGPSRWSNVESVIVPWTESAVSAMTSASPVDVESNGTITVEVRTCDTDWQMAATTAATEWDGWDWTYDWTLPEEREMQCAIQTRARDGVGNVSAIDTITVTLDNKNYFVFFPLLFKRYPPINYPPTLYAIDNPDKMADYTVSWSYSDNEPEVPDPSSYTLQEATDPAFTDPNNYYPGSSTSYDITDPEYEKENGTYYYRVRGHNQHGAGEWSNIESTTVRVTPYAPTLNSIDNPDDGDNYTINWVYDYTYPPANSYTLQEATNADFTGAVNYSTSDKSYTFDDKDEDTYYYRVRGHNDYGAGDWSEIKSTEVEATGYYYDFSQSMIYPSWPIRRASIYDGAEEEWGAWTEEHDGSLFAVINNKWDFAVASPMEEAPSPPYVIQVKSKLHDNTYLRAYGIIFGGNGGTPCPAYRDTGCLIHYYRLQVVAGGGALKADFKRIDTHRSDNGNGQGKSLVGFEDLPGEVDGWNTWKFVVKSDGIDIYLNGSLWHSVDDSTYVNDPHFGVFVANDEFSPGIGRFDYYYVEPQ